LSVGLSLHYTDKPLAFAGNNPAAGGEGQVIEQTLDNRTMGELLLGFSPWPMIDLGVAMPVAIMSTGEDRTENRFSGIGDVSGFHVGEARASLKVNAIRRPTWGLAIQADSTLPTGDPNALMGNGMGYGGRMVADMSFGPVLLAMNGGVYARSEKSTINDLELGDEIVAGLGTEVTINQVLAVVGEAYARTPLGDPFGEATQMEGIAAVKWRATSAMDVSVGGGGGTPLFLGPGTSRFRAFVNIQFGGQILTDTDDDGIWDSSDACPFLPEDFDGFEDGDGCPDADNDNDAFLDPHDECPNQAEDRDGFEDDDGCPDNDNDNDYIDDDVDRCHLDPEDHDGFEDEDGCPDEDNDQDGIPDIRDQCPLTPESYNGFEDEDGCKDFPGVVEVGDRFDLQQAVLFDPNTHELEPASFQVLRDLARYLNENPTYRVRAEVHASLPARTPKNADARHKVMAALEAVTEARGEMLIRFLIMEGVAPGRVDVVPMGATRPVATNDTAKGRYANNRAELFIIR
jgi:outer membrane protein OmpA-like peptidoglycan-associated protein